METQTTSSSREPNLRPGFMQRNALSVKIVLIGVLILLLLIPLGMIRGLIREREYTADRAGTEVQGKWSGAQAVVGPFISIPYYEQREETYYENGKPKSKQTTVTNHLYLLPEELEITGHIETEKLNRGLYEIVVYRTPLELKGKFVLPGDFGDRTTATDLFTDYATLNLGLSDLRGISAQPEVKWGEEVLQFNPGLPPYSLVSSGLSVLLASGKRLQAGDSIDFCIHLDLKGSQSLQFAPFGKTSKVHLTSDCTTPSFTGAFLPEERQVTDTGFTADWQILHLNRNYPQIFTGNEQMGVEELSIFGTELLLPVQQYQKSMRSVKYASLLIILTFVVSFFVEVMQKKNIHPFQYLLIGVALCLFYSLLLAMSEHVNFSLAYLLSALMTVILITLYLLGILKIRKTAYTIGGLLLLMYLYVFVLIQMETYALLAGSLGLFVILAIVMYYSQKINWNESLR